MTDGNLNSVLRHLRRVVESQGAGGLNDSQLLERFITHGDETAFEVLVWRHGPMVLNVCRRILRHDHDAEDAFQATFMTLARKAACIGKRASLASWLYKVAYRAALAAKAIVAKNSTLEKQIRNRTNAGPDQVAAIIEFRQVLDAELNRLPKKYRAPFILCYLEGLTIEQAAHQLGWPKGTVGTRLAWARQRLASRIT
ncbi:MAG TPA: RNA polymerase sigma factor, partial [Gemmataceae bacterium]|nr:RNA polymerase sigma factor [Gemmataceae bacterium]